MKEIIVSPYFKYFVVTIITTIFSIFVKTVSRNDSHKWLTKEDFAIGLELSITALILLITDSVRYLGTVVQSNAVDLTTDDKLVILPWFIFFLLVGLWSISTLVRKKGWKDQSDLNIWPGIIIPNVYGLITLILVVNWMK